MMNENLPEWMSFNSFPEPDLGKGNPDPDSVEMRRRLMKLLAGKVLRRSSLPEAQDMLEQLHRGEIPLLEFEPIPDLDDRIGRIKQSLAKQSARDLETIVKVRDVSDGGFFLSEPVFRASSLENNKTSEMLSSQELVGGVSLLKVDFQDGQSEYWVDLGPRNRNVVRPYRGLLFSRDFRAMNRSHGLVSLESNEARQYLQQFSLTPESVRKILLGEYGGNVELGELALFDAKPVVLVRFNTPDGGQELRWIDVIECRDKWN